MKLNRRAFLQAAVVAAAVAGTGLACSRNRTPWRFFTIDEARALAAISDQIIPPDQDPGASWAGVVNYIDRQLCGPLRQVKEIYRQGLAGVDRSSLLLYGRQHCGLDVENMDTTFKSLKSPHNIHTMKCLDCHTKGVPKSRSATRDRAQVSRFQSLSVSK
jgi:Gluconate 2-dehydrogenase subunit 3